MSSCPVELWELWRTSPEINEIAEAWVTKRKGDWTDDDERLYELIHNSPEQGLATIFAVMQITEEKSILGSLGAGPLEDFLGIHGEQYVDLIHDLALKHRRLREVIDNVWQGSMPKRVWHRIEILGQSRFSSEII